MKQLLICLCLLNAISAIAASTAPGAVIHKDVDKLVALYTDGFGHNNAKSRHIAFGPLFDPDRKDAVAFFTLAEVDLMNGYEEYIAIFAQGQGRSIPGYKDERPYRLIATAQIGTRWGRTFEWKTAKISAGQIVVQGLRWGSGDAGCCPTVPIEVTFSITAANGGDTRYPILRESEGPGRPASKNPPRPAAGKNDK